MIWRKLEIVIVFIALARFARHHYQQGEFLMLFVIYNRLTKEAKLIYEGKKTIEWRKNKPQIFFPGLKVYMYETSPVKKVTGFFYWQGTKNLIIRDPDYEGQEIHEAAKSVIENGCVPLEDLKKYQGNKEKIFGWVCGVFEKFEQPKQLSDFGLKRPPQSWQYI